MKKRLITILCAVAVAAFILCGCGKKSGPACKHDYVLTDSRAASCELGGYKRYTCRKCGDEYTDSEDVLGHDYGAWMTSSLPSCAHDGRMARTCTRENCGDTQVVFSRIPHSYREIAEKRIPPTCAQAGSAVFACTECGAQYTQAIPALPHTPRNAQNTVESVADCLHNGVETNVCAVCDRRYTARVFPSRGGHLFENDVCKECGEIDASHFIERFPATWLALYNDETGEAAAVTYDQADGDWLADISDYTGQYRRRFTLRAETLARYRKEGYGSLRVTFSMRGCIFDMDPGSGVYPTSTASFTVSLTDLAVSSDFSKTFYCNTGVATEKGLTVTLTGIQKESEAA